MIVYNYLKRGCTIIYECLKFSSVSNTYKSLNFDLDFSVLVNACHVLLILTDILWSLIPIGALRNHILFVCILSFIVYTRGYGCHTYTNLIYLILTLLMRCYSLKTCVHYIEICYLYNWYFCITFLNRDYYIIYCICTPSLHFLIAYISTVSVSLL